MATQVQWRRGTTAQVNAFTGAVGEVVYDTQTYQLVTQDGLTVGGHRLALASNSTFNNPTFTGTVTFSSTQLAGYTTSTLTISGGTYLNPALTGTPTAPTPALTSNDTTVPTTTWVRQVIQLTAPINLPIAQAIPLGF